MSAKDGHLHLLSHSGGQGGEASLTHQDSTCTAPLTIEPVTEGHAQVIPSNHYREILELPGHVAGHMFEEAKKIARSCARTTLRCESVSIVMCNGAAASQAVFHTHIHDNPRFEGDGFSWNLPPGFAAPPTHTRLDRTPALLRDARALTP
ncbi:HIT family protein [Xanthomonadaceae bacterium XH05]|nr:HIT family protein [Xanthomonadaceae bacterium XH05]